MGWLPHPIPYLYPMESKPFSSISSPEELRKLPLSELSDFAVQLRQDIIHFLAKGEGHLGSSLGTVELTVALHYCFDTPRDLLVWDVGHQAYGHKMITGRKSDFQNLRQRKGISGFPKRSESPYDTFGTGHAGTAISAVMGMALANQLNGEEHHHIAVVGDASVVNGMSFEALNHLGTTQANVLILLNDNAMGIDPSVGALKTVFEHSKNPPSQAADFFESLNLPYFGPVDGHNLETLVSVFQKQKKIKGPRVLHIQTKKGKGLPLAENQQVTYHAPGKFDPLTGKLNPSQSHSKIKFQEVVGRTLLHLAERNKKIVAITPAMPTGSGLIPMMERFPDRCLDVGIAEQHAVTLAAGMATQGLLPFCVIYSTFLQRAYDQILHDVALQDLKVVFCVDRAGLVGHDGPTHHGVFDIAYLRNIPNLQIAAPKDAKSLQNLLFTVQKELDHPVAIRYPRGYSECESMDFNLKTLPWGKGTQLKQGSHIAVLTVGTLAGVVHQAIKESADPEAFAHFDLLFIKPLDTTLLDSIARQFQALIVFEEGVIQGGAGSAILEYTTQKKYSIPIQLEGIPDRFVAQGPPQLLQKEMGLDLESIHQKLSLLLNKIKGTPSV